MPLSRPISPFIISQDFQSSWLEGPSLRLFTSSLTFPFSPWVSKLVEFSVGGRVAIFALWKELPDPDPWGMIPGIKEIQWFRKIFIFLMPDFHNYFLSKTQHWHINLINSIFALGYSHIFFPWVDKPQDLALKAKGYKGNDLRMKWKSIALIFRNIFIILP